MFGDTQAVAPPKQKSKVPKFLNRWGAPVTGDDFKLFAVLHAYVANVSCWCWETPLLVLVSVLSRDLLLWLPVFRIEP